MGDADSVAVSLYLRGLVPNLTLHLPAPFLRDKRCFADTDAGRTSNRYHIRATSMHGLDGLGELQMAIDKGANVTTEDGPGMGPFFARNGRVARDAGALVAFTYGAKGSAALKDGGSASTMGTFLKRRGTIPYEDCDMQMAFRASAWHYNLTDNRLSTL